MTESPTASGRERRGTAGDRPRVLVLTQYYRPEPNFITADVAEALARDADVTVVAAAPNYPTGRFYPGHPAARPTRRVENGVTVWRLPHVPDRSVSKARRAVSYLSFTAAAAAWVPFVCPRPDVVWVYHTPFTTALAALAAKYLAGARLVLTSADLWPESFLAAGVAESGPIVDAAFAFSRWINRRADDIVCTTRGTLRRYAADGVPASRLHFVPVWVEGVPDVRGLPVVAPDADPPRIVYAGNLGPAQALDTIVEAAALLQRDGVSARFALYGAGSVEGELRALAERLGADNVEFHGRVAPEQAFEAIVGATAQVVALRRSPFFRMTVPSKLFGAFAAGTPILCGLEGEAAEMAEASGGAFRYDAEDAASLARAVREVIALPPGRQVAIRRDMRTHYASEFRRDLLLERYRALLLDGVRVPSTLTAHPAT